MNLSDYIMGIIQEELDENFGSTSISRNEMANKIGCAPSQISYVLTSRFTPERGYIVESRRGGGGFIRITRIEVKPENLIMHVVNSIGRSIDEASCKAILVNLKDEKIISQRECSIMINAVSINTLCEVLPESRKQVRATIFKNMLLGI